MCVCVCVGVHVCVCVHVRACTCMRVHAHVRTLVLCMAPMPKSAHGENLLTCYDPRQSGDDPQNAHFRVFFFARLRRASEFLHSKNEKHETVDFPGECTGFKGVLFLKNFLRAILKKLRSARPYREPCEAPRLLLRRRHLESRPSRAKRKRGLRRAAPGPRPSPGVRKRRIKNWRW